MNSEKYRNEFHILSQAAAGVVLTRTREPHRVLQVLSTYAFDRGMGFKEWNFRDGWVHPNPQPDLPPVRDGNADPYSALRVIADLDGDGSKKWGNVLLVMVWPEQPIGQFPPLDETLRRYAREFPETAGANKVRLVLVTPESYQLPDKLQHDIPVLDFSLPSADELDPVFRSLCDSVSEGGEFPFTEKEVASLVALGCGMTEAEFELSCAKAIALRRADWPKVEMQFIANTVAASKTEIVKRSEVLELMAAEDPNNIGGLQLLKQWIDRRKGVFGQDARDAGVDAPKGVVLIGPPGTGKSMCAKAVSGVLELPLIKFDISRCFAGIVGQTEGRVRSALKQVEAMAPCVVFLDEVDKAGIDPRQAGGDSGVSKRLMGSILTFMQESEAPMFWILTANRPDSLPPELLRKGRMDEVFSVLPPNRDERREIVRIHLRKRKRRMLRGEDLEKLLDASKGYVGAEIEAAIKEAVVDSFTEGTEVTGDAIRSHLANMKPISVAFKDDFDRMTAWASNNARPSSIQDDSSTKETSSAPAAVKVTRRIRAIN